MRRTTMLITLVFVSAMVTLGLNSKHQDIPANSSISEREKREIASRPMEIKQTVGPQKNIKNTTITQSEIVKLHQRLPKKKLVEKEINKNPHSPSKTLMTFAKALGPLMEKALKNPKDADLLSEVLSECARNGSIANAARAACVTNTERLAKIYPEIEKKAEDLRAEVSPEVQKILDTNDSFIKK